MESGLLTTAVVTEGTLEFISGTSYQIIWPTTHGLKVHDLCVVNRDATSCCTWLSTHAALVSHAQSKNFLLHFKSASFLSYPAAHGLDVQGLTLIDRIKDSAVDWTSTHAALVSQTKTAPELHELPRIKKTFVHVWRLHRFTLIFFYHSTTQPTTTHLSFLFFHHSSFIIHHSIHSSALPLFLFPP
ncbi:MAG: hypothetical protein NT166_31545 [Candidatus Aminicenantes bacterium]|nr:hypothetical protein [Candidatus Aminicenantes bacterium]